MSPMESRRVPATRLPRREREKPQRLSGEFRFSWLHPFVNREFLAADNNPNFLYIQTAAGTDGFTAETLWDLNKRRNAHVTWRICGADYTFR